MSVDTIGRLLGFVKPNDILTYIQNRYDANATSDVKFENYGDIDALGPYKINPHSTDDKHHYVIAGFIYFNYKGEDRMMFYDYSNVNFLENMEYYSYYNLEDMVEAETTYLSFGCYETSIEIIQDLLHAFHGGWIDENDCDDDPYYFVPSQKWKNGGIYKRKNFDEYFIVVKVHDAVYTYDVIKGVQDNLSVSNADIIDALSYQSKTPLTLSNFLKIDFEKMQEKTDGYLGQIELWQEDYLMQYVETMFEI